MTIRNHRLVAAVAALALAAVAGAATAQLQSFEIPTKRMDDAKDAIAAQAADPKWKRDATLPEDWVYTLAPGVTTRQVSFYVDGGTRLYGKLYLPKGFDPVKYKYPAVVVGHGINAVSLGIEKYAARIAERGIPAMAIDYQSYGYSDSGSDNLLLLEPDTSTDASPVTIKRLPVKVKRTNLNNVQEVEDFRAAVSYLQGEPGIDPNRIGTWATSNGGIVTHTLITVDARIRASVIHVMSTAPSQPRAVTITGPALTDAIQRVRTGQGGESDAGFSFPTKIDTWGNSRNRDIPGPSQFDRTRPTTAILWLPDEKDQLVGPPARGAIPTVAYMRERGIPAQVIVFPGLTHFQPYSGPAFEVGSNLAADWYEKQLGGPVPAGAPSPIAKLPASTATTPLVAPAAVAPAKPLPAGVSMKEVSYFSEQVRVSGRLFTPSTPGKHPAVVIAPGWGQTAASMDAYGAALAAQGIVAMAVDYRGWGKAGGFIYLNERVFTDDRQRFSLHTPQLAIRRGRLDPESQVQDLRNAITYLQGEANVDPAKIGLLGADMAGGHVISVLGMDGRAKAGVAITPVIAGAGEERKSHIPTASEQAALIRLARTGRPPQTAAEARARNAEESRLALMDYKPAWRIPAIPATDAVQFIVAGVDERVDNNRHAVAVQKALKGPTEMKIIAGAKHDLTASQTQEAAQAAAEFLKGKL